MKLNSNDVEIPTSSVSVYEAIFRRRSVKEFTDEPVSRETLERLFSTAIWAPNHRLTEPTRFFSVRKDSPARLRIAASAWQAAYDGVVNPNPQQKKRSADASRDRVLNAPAMVYVYSLKGDNDEITQENYASSCCSIQNMALAAVAEGLNVDWTTGSLTRIPGLAQMLGADDDWTMVGLIMIGKATSSPERGAYATLRTGHMAGVTGAAHHRTQTQLKYSSSLNLVHEPKTGKGDGRTPSGSFSLKEILSSSNKSLTEMDTPSVGMQSVHVVGTPGKTPAR